MGLLKSYQQCIEHETIHILFDSYLKISIKGSNRARQKGEEEGKELATMDEFVTILTQIEKFGSVNTNNENL